jgi:hypothetical protein
VEAVIAATLDGLDLDDAVRGVWDILIPHLPPALSGGDDGPLLAAAERSARGVALARQASVAVLLEGYLAGCEALAAALGARAAYKAAAGELVRLRPAVLRGLAAGYAAGLEDIIEQLDRRAAAASPIDDATGAMKPAATVERLTMEVLRCQRMDLSLGVLEMAVGLEGEAGPRRTERVAAAQREVSECLRDSLRRYDSIGLTPDGGLLLVLPDVTRRGLAAAAERLRREIAECAGDEPQLVLALAHYDYVDVAASDVVATLERGMERARSRGEALAWV